jgi:uncharacterized protein (TIGR02147 family)
VGQFPCTSFHFQLLSMIVARRYIVVVKTNLLATTARPTAMTCFRLFLQAELGRRCDKNPQYSLRAFAKYLGIDHATISQLLRGKRPLTSRTILKLGTRLGLDRAAIDGYVAHEAFWRNDSADESALSEIQQLANDAANVIADWYHYAILELTRLHNFKPNSRWIARVLGITPDEVNLAVSRLARLGLLEMVDRDRWIDKSGNTTASLAEFSRAAVQRLSEQVRQRMFSAVGAVPAGCFEHSTTTLALSTARLPLALERIARFRRELITLLQDDAAPDDVFQLEINFFPVTNLRHDKEQSSGTTRDAVADPGQTTG